jgi:hypothetical protein
MSAVKTAFTSLRERVHVARMKLLRSKLRRWHHAYHYLTPEELKERAEFKAKVKARYRAEQEQFLREVASDMSSGEWLLPID